MSTTQPESHPTDTPDGTDDSRRTDTPPRYRDGSTDPLPNRGNSDLVFCDLASEHDDPDTLFERAILQNPHTCRNCFARVGRQWELPNCDQTERLDGMVSFIHHEVKYQIPKNERRGRLDWRYYQSEAFRERTGFIPDPFGHSPSKRILMCHVCGHQRHPPDGPTTYGLYTGEGEGVPHVPVETDDDAEWDTDDPRDLLAMMRAAHTLSNTLSEYGISHDARILIDTTRVLKKIPRLSTRDDEVFGRAVARSIRAYRRLRAQNETSLFHRPQSENE